MSATKPISIDDDEASSCNASTTASDASNRQNPAAGATSNRVAQHMVTAKQALQQMCQELQAGVDVSMVQHHLDGFVQSMMEYLAVVQQHANNQAAASVGSASLTLKRKRRTSSHADHKSSAPQPETVPSHTLPMLPAADRQTARPASTPSTAHTASQPVDSAQPALVACKQEHCEVIDIDEETKEREEIEVLEVVQLHQPRSTEMDTTTRLFRARSSCHLCGAVDDTMQQLAELEGCQHRVCYSCLRKHLTQSLSPESAVCSVNCPVPLTSGAVCKQRIPDRMKRQVLTTEQLAALEQKEVQQYMHQSNSKLVTCTHCNAAFEAVTGGSTPGDNTDADGKLLSMQARDHLRTHRFRCPQCSNEFCSGCDAKQYHRGFTCRQWRQYQNAKHCRFCDAVITVKAPSDQLVIDLAGDAAISSAKKRKASSTTSLPSDVCSSKQCLRKWQQVCQKPLKCTHPCCGIRDEKRCIGCMQDDCKGNGAAIDGTDYCNICWTESLTQAPCIQLQCKHTFHYACILSKLEKRWPGARITFGFLQCPLCKVDMQHSAIDYLVEPYKLLKEKVGTKAVQRLEMEGLNDEEKQTQQERYRNDAKAYAMDRFAYYPCSKCREPYFGGRRQCEEVKENDEKFNLDELVCGGCSAGADAQTCQQHGKEYIDFKCKFCCSIASYFCFGTTHFCDKCHTKPGVVMKMSPAQLPKCKGAKQCPLGINHVLNGHGNGHEFALGCSLCRHST